MATTVQLCTALPSEACSPDVSAAKKAVRAALADMRHAMDIRDEDGMADRQGWIELELAAVSLMLRAYYRNHNTAVPSMTRTTKTAAMPRILIFSAAKLPGGKNSRPDLGLRANNRLPGADREKTGHLSNVKPIDPADRHIFDGPVDMIELYRAGLKRPTLGQKLVAFFRMNGETLSFWFALASVGFGLAVVGGAFLGWQR